MQVVSFVLGSESLSRYISDTRHVTSKGENARLDDTQLVTVESGGKFKQLELV